MRIKTGSTGWTLWPGLLLAGTLLFAPAVWATGEDAREQEAQESEGGEKQDAKGEPSSPTTKPASAAAQQKAKIGQSITHPTFNTVEEIRSYHGTVAALWTCEAKPEPVVTWREVDP